MKTWTKGTARQRTEQAESVKEKEGGNRKKGKGQQGHQRRETLGQKLTDALLSG